LGDCKILISRQKTVAFLMESKKQGTLFLIVGNSGSGKDSIIRELQKICSAGKLPLHVATRYITRPPHESEPYIYLNPDEFYRLKNEGQFFLTWHIYGLDYGIGKEVSQCISEGINVIANVSRTIISKARQITPSVKVIFIFVPYEITLCRLINRQRESGNGHGLKMRLFRAKENQTIPEADFVIENVGPLDQSVLKISNYMLSVI
jgi:ribose 1,5-bisphosphokinase